jgi:hypothetical protein
MLNDTTRIITECDDSIFITTEEDGTVWLALRTGDAILDVVLDRYTIETLREALDIL